jgi:hypothetical protein
MAAAKRYTAEQIVAKLREVEKLQGPRVDDPGSLQEARVQRADVLPVAHGVRGAEGGRGASAACVGAGARAAQADRGRAGLGHLDVEGSEPGNF